MKLYSRSKQIGSLYNYTDEKIRTIKSLSYSTIGNGMFSYTVLNQRARSRQFFGFIFGSEYKYKIVPLCHIAKRGEFIYSIRIKSDRVPNILFWRNDNYDIT